VQNNQQANFKQTFVLEMNWTEI